MDCLDETVIKHLILSHFSLSFLIISVCFTYPFLHRLGRDGETFFLFAIR